MHNFCGNYHWWKYEIISCLPKNTHCDQCPKNLFFLSVLKGGKNIQHFLLLNNFTSHNRSCYLIFEFNFLNWAQLKFTFHIIFSVLSCSHKTCLELDFFLLFFLEKYLLMLLTRWAKFFPIEIRFSLFSSFPIFRFDWIPISIE